METIGESVLWSFFDAAPKARVATNTAIRRGDGHEVASYLDLATKIAELQFKNRDHVLVFRGQRNDYRNRNNNTSLKPTLFRPVVPNRNPGPTRLTRRFEILRNAEEQLVRHYERAKLDDLERLKRHRILRWSILQHYEVCRTPLLDVTHSLRIAASFASVNAKGEAFVFVLGVPNLSGAITASAEGGLQIVRLSSVCPPSAIRPHIQEGYLLGEYPEMSDFQQKQNYAHYEIDFGRRLVAKFRLNPKRFWKKNDAFPPVSEAAFYPDDADPLCILSKKVHDSIDTSED